MCGLVSSEGVNYQNHTRVNFEDVPKDILKKISNGCGGAGSWIVPPHAIFFETCCDHHDYGYWVGGTEIRRKECDKKLYQAMLKDCEKLPWYKKIKYRPWCELYYLSVRFLGDNYFYYGMPRWPKIKGDKFNGYNFEFS